MYLVSKESNRECRRSNDLKKLMYMPPDAGRRKLDKSVSDKLRLTKVSGAKKLDFSLLIVHLCFR